MATATLLVSAEAATEEEVSLAEESVAEVVMERVAVAEEALELVVLDELAFLLPQ